MQGTDARVSTDFLAGLFGADRTEALVYLCSLPNAGAKDREPGERHVATRDPAAVQAFVEKWDRPDRGMFFCISTVRPGSTHRAKDTVAELPILHADIDFKDVAMPMAAVLEAIDRLPNRPSVVVSSGRGLHLYWLLKEAVDASDANERDRIEAAARQVADLVGGDVAVAEVARLMRLPGTHNTKDGGAARCVVLSADFERVHLLEDLEEMLGFMSPAVRKKAPPAAQTTNNPFLAAAQRLGFKPPIDVETRLLAMTYQGAGDSSIHATQVSVSAALLNRGVALDEVVSTVLEATWAAAGAFGENWNRVREERVVRRMCEDWVRKNPREPQASVTSAAPQQRTTAQVVPIESARAARAAKPRTAPKDKAPPAHVVLAAAMIEGSETEGRPFLSVSESSGERQLWRYADGLWSMVASIDVEVEVAARALGISTSLKLRSETMAAIKADPAVVCAKADIVWDGHGLVPARNGLVDITTLEIQPYRPEHRATWHLPFDFEAAATCPKWELSLATFFRDKEPVERVKYAALIQDVTGAGFLAVKPRALSRALVLYGLENAGKSQILNVLTRLYGKMPIAQPLKSLEGEHGTVPFVRHAPWVLHEAFNQSQWVFSDKVKQLITGEPIQINIKRGAQFEHVFRAPIFWGTNHSPSFRESSRAIVSRLLVVPCKGDFCDDDPIDVAAEAVAAGFSSLSEYLIEREGPGILRWAVEGLRRVLARGKFDPPAEMAALSNQIYIDSNAVAEFVRDCCSFDPRKMVRVPDLMAAFAVWFGDQRGEDLKVPSANTVSRAMKALPESVLMCADRDVFRKNSVRFYGGVVLNDEGLDYWRGIKASRIAEGRASRIADGEGLINQVIPSDWIRDSAEARNMIMAHERRERERPPDKRDQLGDQLRDRWVTNSDPSKDWSRQNGGGTLF